MAGKGQKEKEIHAHQKSSIREEDLEDARGLDAQVKPIIGHKKKFEVLYNLDSSQATVTELALNYRKAQNT